MLHEQHAEPPAGSRTEWKEGDRIAALLSYGILDTPPEPDFDNITRVASLVLDAPISCVNLITDTRQWFKSEIGLGVRETPLDVSICAKAILQPGVFVVPDTTKDVRFNCNPLVTDAPHLRFYAGARLDTPGGLPLGTVCVLDYTPRPEGISETQRQILLALARQAMAHFELRRAVDAHELLANELSHRIKNILSVVSGLASASARDTETARPFANAFQARVAALSKAHDYILPRNSGAGSRRENTVKGLLGLLLSPYDGARKRIWIEGDDASIGTQAATALSLVLHEQATNAIKYGALSNEKGSLLIHGEISGGDFVLSWEERDGPAISGPPQHSGFGTTMADRSVSAQLGGTIDRNWTPEGLRLRLTVPLENLGR